MNIIINGKSKETKAQNVQDLLKEQGQDLEAGGLAVAVNDTVIPKKNWNEKSLRQGDRVEVIRATQGG